MFGELVIPVTKALELGTAVRVDSYSDFGNATTGKASFRWTPASNWLVRGSVGNGFHAPTVPQVNATQQSYGVTVDNYTCTPALQAMATAKGAQCQTGNRQYDQMAGGNPQLLPEKSTQATLGLRFEPNNSMSFGADLWHVKIEDKFGQLTEQLVFANPGAFPNSFTTKTDIGTGKTFLAFLGDNQNLGNSYSTGIDLDFSGRTKTSLGLLSTQLTMTYVLREASQLQKDGPYYSSVGDFSDLGKVTFRTKGRLSTSLKTGDWTNTLAANFQSGYKDQETSVEVLDAAGVVTGTEKIRMEVDSYVTFDWQTVWSPGAKKWSVTAGVQNLFDQAPPLAISSGGENRGQQFGYDDRYYDSRGRTVYVNASYMF
jgi:iron complex outermembrane receptor protein